MAFTSTQFKLLRKEKDPQFNIDYLEHYNLLLQVGFSDLQLSITDTREKRILLFEDYIMPGVNSHSESVECLECLFDDHHLLLAGFWKRIRLLVKNRKFALIPSTLFQKENADDYIKLNASLEEDDLVLYNQYEYFNLVNSFAINKTVYEFINKTYPKGRKSIFHQSSSLIHGSKEYCKQDSGESVNLYLDRFVLHVTVMKGEKLRFYNQYPIKKFDDYFRFLGYVVQELKIDKAKTPFNIWGYFGENSSHFNNLKAKFPTLKIGKRPAGLTMGYVFDEIPDHQYFDLLSLNLIP